MNEILITIMVGVTVAIVSNIVSHYLALNREKKKAECLEIMFPVRVCTPEDMQTLHFLLEEVWIS